jgi:hypothetical protein
VAGIRTSFLVFRSIKPQKTAQDVSLLATISMTLAVSSTFASKSALGMIAFVFIYFLRYFKDTHRDTTYLTSCNIVMDRDELAAENIARIGLLQAFYGLRHAAFRSRYDTEIGNSGDDDNDDDDDDNGDDKTKGKGKNKSKEKGKGKSADNKKKERGGGERGRTRPGVKLDDNEQKRTRRRK